MGYYPNKRRNLERLDLRAVLDLLFIYVLTSEVIERDGDITQGERDDLHDFYVDSHLATMSGVPRNDVGILLQPFYSLHSFESLMNYKYNVALADRLGKFIDDLENYYNYRVHDAGPSYNSKINSIIERLERKMLIQNSDYISMRRLICNWDVISENQRAIACTRLLQAARYRTNTGKIELEPILYRWMKRRNLKLNETYNAELDQPIGSGITAGKVLAGVIGGIAGAIAGFRSLKK